MGLVKIPGILLFFFVVKIDFPVAGNPWALEECQEGNIDLVLVGDASFTCNPFNQKGCKQLDFLASVIDLFSSPSEIILDRLKVALLVIKTSTVDPCLNFDSVKNKTELKNNIKKQITENQNIAFGTISKPSLAINATILMDLHGTNVVRPNTTFVMVLVTNQPTANFQNIFEHEMKKLNIYINTKLFVLALQDNQRDQVILTPKMAIYKLSEIREDIARTVTVIMCNTCYMGWFITPYEDTYINNSIKMSCYKTETRETEIPWLAASELCRQYDSQLVSIETEEKLVSIRKALSSQFGKFLLSENLKESASIYIGLTRQRGTIGKRFRWVNNNPLVFNRWGPSEPKGGSIFGCAVWDLGYLNYSITVDDLLNETRMFSSADFTGTWSAVGCGKPKLKSFLCEYKIEIQSPTIPKTYDLKQPNDEHFANAVRRGELGLYRTSNQLNLFSLSTLLKVWKYFIKQSEISLLAIKNHSVNQTVPFDQIIQYHCEINDGIIPYTAVCDYSTDCHFYVSEETNCRKCNKDSEMTCQSGQCLPLKAQCDGYVDCKDGSDEKNCDICNQGLCIDGRCIPKNWFADSEVDCSGDDPKENVTYEMKYSDKNKITQCLFICNRTECVYRSMLNDSVIDCKGPEGPIDETIGALESTVCYTELDSWAGKFSNWGPKCIYYLDIYGEPLGCRNMNHLLGCEGFTCPDGYYKCPASYCIPTHYILNNVRDCPLGEDENSEITRPPCNNYFICQASSQFPMLSVCVHPNLVCDGRVDCVYGDDELNCNVPCREGFECLAGTVIFNDKKKAKSYVNFGFIHSSTRYLDLSGMDLSANFPSSFIQIDLSNLIELRLSDCSISDVKFNSESCNLDSVRLLDLSYNDIKNITVNTILRCTDNLNFLNLSNNEHLTTFEPRERDINKLKTLDLSSTGVSFISKSVISQLKNLKYLNLHNTLIINVKFLPQILIEVIDVTNTQINDLLYADMFKNVTITKNLFTDSFKLCCPQLHNQSTNLSGCVSKKDPFSSCSDLMSNTVLRVVLWTDGILAVSGNLAVMVYRLFFDRNIFKMAYGHFVTHLGISDFLMGGYLAIIASADTSYRDEYFWNEWTWRNGEMCKLAGFLSTLSTEVSTVFIFLITLDRFLVIKYPFGQCRLGGKTVKICCAITWLIGSVVALVPILPNVKSLNMYNTNGMCLGLPLTSNLQSGRPYAVAIFLFLNFFMFVMIACGQIAIYKTVSVMRINQTYVPNSNSRRSQDLSMAKNLSLVVLTNFMCWFPIGLMGIMALCGYEISTDAYAWSAVLILPINSSINPLLYTFPTLARKLGQFMDTISSERFKKKMTARHHEMPISTTRSGFYH